MVGGTATPTAWNTSPPVPWHWVWMPSCSLNGAKGDQSSELAYPGCKPGINEGTPIIRPEKSCTLDFN
jgi:hypothetical protein